MFTRRDLLKGMMLAGGFCLLPLGRRGWALAAPEAAQKHMVMVLMRGAVDGLSLVTPYTEPHYYRVRSSIALPPPKDDGGLIDLDGFFGLHPSLSALMPLWQNRTLAFVQASGSPAETRSHFEAQDIMETALLDSAMAKQGWMNGLAQILPANGDPTRALSFGNTLPKIFQGTYDVTTVPLGLRPPANGGTGGNPLVDEAFGRLYGSHPALNKLYEQATAARADMIRDLDKEMVASARGAPGAAGFAEETAKVADMIKADPRIQLVFMDVGGWDTHVNQGNSKGQLANRLKNLGDGLAALAEGLGPAWDDTAVVVMSEFGRTVAENGNAGTDHGHGNVAWVLGGRVKGGKVWGRWPGLEEAQLYENRDLKVTTDFRSILGRLAAAQFDLDDKRIAQFIPGYRPDPGLKGIIA